MASLVSCCCATMLVTTPLQDVHPSQACAREFSTCRWSKDFAKRYLMLTVPQFKCLLYLGTGIISPVKADFDSVHNNVADLHTLSAVAQHAYNLLWYPQASTNAGLQTRHVQTTIIHSVHCWRTSCHTLSGQHVFYTSRNSLNMNQPWEIAPLQLVPIRIAKYVQYSN